MKLLKSSVVVFILSIFAIGLSNDLYAQDKRAVFKAYNQGIELKKSGEFDQAISVFNQTIANAEELGTEGEDVLSRAQQQLVDTYYRKAVSSYQQLQKSQSIESFNSTITAFKDALDTAKEYNNSKMSDKITGIIPQLLYQKGLYAFKSGSNEAALTSLDEAIQRNPDYANAYYQIAIIKKNTDGVQQSEVVSAFEKALEVGNQQSNNSVVEESKKQLSGIFLSQGHALVSEQKQYEEGISKYQTALEYTPDNSQIYFRLAEAYNKTQQWQQAISHAEKGLNYESGGKTEQAKYYFEMATAYKGLGEKDSACSAYGNAAFGSFKSPAEHQMEYELKCESTTN